MLIAEWWSGTSPPRAPPLAPRLAMCYHARCATGWIVPARSVKVMLRPAYNRSHTSRDWLHGPLVRHFPGAAEQDGNCRDRGRFRPQDVRTEAQTARRGQPFELA